MQLKVVSTQGVKKFNELKVGDLILCEGNVYLPIKNIMMISGYQTFFRTSNNLAFHISKRIQLKTAKGFKVPELWDTLILQDIVTPMITTVTLIERIDFFYDILIDGNPVSPEGIIFRYSD